MATQAPDIQKADGTVNEKAIGATTHERSAGTNQ